MCVSCLSFTLNYIHIMISPCSVLESVSWCTDTGTYDIISSLRPFYFFRTLLKISSFSISLYFFIIIFLFEIISLLQRILLFNGFRDLSVSNEQRTHRTKKSNRRSVIRLPIAKGAKNHECSVILKTYESTRAVQLFSTKQCVTWSVTKNATVSGYKVLLLT